MLSMMTSKQEKEKKKKESDTHNMRTHKSVVVLIGLCFIDIGDSKLGALNL